MRYMYARNSPSPFKTFEEAAEALVSCFIGENVASPREPQIRAELYPPFLEALKRDGVLPNRYEVEALNGCVPEDGSDPDEFDAGEKDYGVPPDVAAKFPHTNRAIGDQF